MKRITNNIPASIACICLFGFSAGCFNSMMFLRMYALGMAFGMIFLYFTYVFFDEDNKKDKIIALIISFISLFAGAYTLHLFLVYAFPLVLCVCLGYLFYKKIKEVFIYGFSCLGSVGLSFLAFPKTVSDTMQSSDSYSYSMTKYSDFMQFRIYSFLTTLDIFGFHTSPYSNPWIKISIAIFLFFAILSIPLIILFRKEIWFRKFLSNTKNRIKLYFKDIKPNFVFLFACLAATVFVIYIASIKTSVYIMSIKYTARYVYMIYPVLCIFTTLAFYYIFSLIISNKRITVVIMVTLSLFIASVSQLLNNQPYLMLHEEKGISLDKIEEDANCYILLMSNWFIVCFADKLYDTNSYYFTDYSNYINEIKCFDSVDSNKPLYLIMDCSVIITDEVKKEMEENPDSLYNTVYADVMIEEDEVLNHYRSLNCVESIDLVGEDNLFERPIKIFKVNIK